METITSTSVPVVPRNQGKAPVPLKRASSDPAPLPKPASTEGQIDQKLAQAESQRLARLKQAASSLGKSFAIYKDTTTGQYITRFTENGKVTYIPEPDVVAWLNQSKQTIDPSISIDA